jgi:hypothetical protein
MTTTRRAALARFNVVEGPEADIWAVTPSLTPQSFADPHLKEHFLPSRIVECDWAPLMRGASVKGAALKEISNENQGHDA